MTKPYKITKEQVEEIKGFRKTNKDKNVEKRLRAVQLRGEGFKDNCNTKWTNLFLDTLSNQFPNDYILLCEDNASWHKANNLIIPNNIELFFIPPATPEMNPIEQIWDEVKEKDFDNRFFNTLNKVVDQLCLSINNLDKKTIKSITGREWILSTT